MSSLIAQLKTAAPANANPRPDLPPLTPYNAVSLWVKVDKNGKPSMSTITPLFHAIGKTGAGLNGAVDRIRSSFHKNGDVGREGTPVAGMQLFAFALEPVDGAE